MKKFIVPTILLLALVSCRNEERDLYSPSDANAYTADTYVGQFQEVWGGLSEAYVYWPWTVVDWDSVYDANYQAFKDQDNSGKRMAEAEFHDRWASILGGLVDHNMVARIRNFGSDSLHVFDPADMHRRKRPNYHEPMEADTTVLDTISPSVYLRVGTNCTDSLKNSLRRYLTAETTTSLIVDVRSTPGSEEWLKTLTGLLTPERIAYAAHRTKFTSSPLDLTQPVMTYMEPAAEQAGLRRIVCLTDMYSRGSAERLVMALCALRNYGFTIQLVGEQSLGAMGLDYPDTDSKFSTYYAGSFGDKDIAKHRKSTYYIHAAAATTQDPETLNCLEGIGIAPDVPCASGEALTTAVALLKSNQ